MSKARPRIDVRRLINKLRESCDMATALSSSAYKVFKSSRQKTSTRINSQVNTVTLCVRRLSLPIGDKSIKNRTPVRDDLLLQNEN